MIQPCFTVKKGGMLTTVQDLGRVGFQWCGMPVAGVMDRTSYTIGQWLVGNESPLAALECTMLGPTLHVECACIVAFTGADMKPQINGEDVAMYTAIACKAGDEIATSFASIGSRMYISVRGGFAVPLVNGSASTHTKSKIGGFEGRGLQEGDVLCVNSSDELVPLRSYDTSGGRVSDWDFAEPIRFVWGPQDTAFTATGRETFVNAVYRISSSSDRMGYRMEGDPIEHVDGADIISDATIFGSIQVPADGHPIVLMADCQTTGGYTKIGTVISYDLPRLAQMPLGHEVRFVAIDVTLAQRLLRYNQSIVSLQ